MKLGNKDVFWLSYSDLMTSMFFVMLVLFIVTMVKLNPLIQKVGEYDIIKDSLTVTKAERDHIIELQKSIERIDTRLFKYNRDFKRYTLNGIDVSFVAGSSDINDIPEFQRLLLLEAGRDIVKFMKNAKKEIQEAQYLLIVEGQSSKDNYSYNYELSYSRALSLLKYWASNGVVFDSSGNCEVIISGSGQSSTFRVEPDIATNANNQRFVIHIIPKPGNF